MWMREAPSGGELRLRPAMAGGAPDAEGDSPVPAGSTALPAVHERESESELAEDAAGRGPAPGARAHPEVTAVAVVFGAASLVLGIIPGTALPPRPRRGRRARHLLTELGARGLDAAFAPRPHLVSPVPEGIGSGARPRG